MEQEKKWFSAYIKQIIFLTFGFEPEVEITFLSNTTVLLTLDGTAEQRSIIMGKEAVTFKSLKSLLKSYARRNGYYSYLYIKSKGNEKNPANIDNEVITYGADE